jgi:hypothetical protein
MPRRLRVAFAAAGAYALAAAGASYTAAGGAATFGYGSAAPPPPPPQAGLPQVKLLSSTSGTKPFALGFSLKAGAVPAGQDLVIANATARAAVMNRWPDGSMRFVIIGGTYASVGGVETILTMSAGSVSAGAALTGAAVQAAMGASTAVFDCGAFGIVTFSGSDFASPQATHFATDRCAEFAYRKQVGSDAHLVAWLHVRVFSTGEVEHLPAVENGYLLVAGPTNKSATYTFTLGGTLRETLTIDLTHHGRTPLVSDTRLSHWLGADPGVDFKHDTAYLQSTEVVPAYAALIEAGNAQVTALPSTYTPLQQGSYTYVGDVMSGFGFAAPIGLLPNHDVLYLCSPAYLAAQVQRNAYSAGRYPIHWRDHTTNGMPVFATYPDLAIGQGQGITNCTSPGSGWPQTPAVTGTAPPQWDLAHCPSVGYMAYLLTGRRYHMETAQFAAVANHYHQDPAIRSNADGVMRSFGGANDTRHTAWGLRSLWQALAVTPEADTSIRPSFKAALESTIDFHHSRYVAQAHNPLGFTEPGQDYLAGNAAWGDRLFMVDFSVASWGYALAANLTLGSGYSAKLAAFMAWHGKATVGRLGNPENPQVWQYMNAVTYNGAVAPSAADWAGGTGPWFANFREAQDATYLTAPPWLGTAVDYRAGEAAPGENTPGDSIKSFWGNIQPAISYCVRHGLAGALDAYRLMLSARNAVFLVEELQDTAVWGVVPATGWQPAWLGTQTVGAFKNIAGTTLAGSAAAPSDAPADIFSASARRVAAYVGMAVRQRNGELTLALDGGHNDNSENSTRSLQLFNAAPLWAELNANTPLGQRVAEQPYYADGKPASQHTNWSPQWHETTLRGARLINRYSRNVFGGPAPSFPASNGLRVTDNQWDAAGTWLDATFLTYGVDPLTGTHWGQGGGSVRSWSSATDTETIRYSFSNVNPMGAPWCWHPTTRQMFTLCWGDGQASGSGVTAYLVGTSSRTPITFNASAAYTQFQADAPAYCSMEWDWFNRCFVFYEGRQGRETRVYVIKPNSGTAWDMSLYTVAAGSDTPAYATTGSAGALCNKFRYVPALRGFVLLSSGAYPAAFLRTF